MSQCSQPCVWAIIDTELPVPPTGKPLFSSSAISGPTFANDDTMNSMFERIVNRTWLSAYWSAMSHSLRIVCTSICRCVPARTVQTSSPVCDDVVQHARARPVVVFPVAVVLDQQRVQELPVVGDAAFDRPAHLGWAMSSPQAACFLALILATSSSQPSVRT